LHFIFPWQIHLIPFPTMWSIVRLGLALIACVCLASAWQSGAPLASQCPKEERPTHRPTPRPSSVERRATSSAGDVLDSVSYPFSVVKGPRLESLYDKYERGLDDVPLPLQASIFRLIPAHRFESPNGLLGDPAAYVLASTFLLDGPREPLFVTRSDKVIDADYVILQSTITNSTLLGRVVMKCPRWDVAFVKLHPPYTLDRYKQYVSDKLGGVVPEAFVAGNITNEGTGGTPVMTMGYLANSGSLYPADVEVGEDKLNYSPYDGPATNYGTLKDEASYIENGLMLSHDAVIPLGFSGGPTVDRSTGKVLGMSDAGLGSSDPDEEEADLPASLSVFAYKLLMLAEVYADHQKDGFATIARHEHPHPPIH